MDETLTGKRGDIHGYRTGFVLEAPKKVVL